MRSKKSITILPKQGPDLLEVGFGQGQAGHFFTPEECEPAFAMRRWQTGEARFHFKQEHEPVSLPVVAMLAHESHEMEVAGLNFDAEFFPGLAASRGVRRFAAGRVDFSAAGTPKPQIRLLRALHQEDAILFVETIKQRRNLVRKRRHNHFTKTA